MTGNGENLGWLHKNSLRKAEFFSALPQSDARFRLSICIPAYKEKNLVKVLESLLQCEVKAATTVFVLINASENDSEALKSLNNSVFEEVLAFAERQKPLYNLVLLMDNAMPAAKAGVGLARRTVMNYAVENFGEKDHVLVALDADCTVSENYLNEITQFFKTHKNLHAASIYFEHPIPEEKRVEEGIVLYELHLRYLKNALQWSGFPWYFHTVGSSMAVRASMYKKQGGMNTRQAGEDYYFLHKLMPHGFGEITGCTVFPEARISDRVPFGTGRSMGNFLNEEEEITTYNPEIFRTLKPLFSIIHQCEPLAIQSYLSGDCPKLLQRVLTALKFENAVQEALQNSSSVSQTRQRIWKWFSGFTIIKIMHALRDSGMENMKPEMAVSELFEANGNRKELLNFLRQKDRVICSDK